MAQKTPPPDPKGEAITLSEAAGVRYLHFGSEWIQGAMRIAKPYGLELEYQQQMMLPWLLLPRPRRILQLGLGAASLAKFCHRHLPFAQTVVVELDRMVIRAARQWFDLPDEDERLRIVCGDARRFLQRPRCDAFADWLQVDLYDSAARGPVYDDPSFYLECRRALREPGVAAFNLFGSRCGPSLDRIAAAFDGRVMVMDEARGGNRIAVAAVGPAIQLQAPQLSERARAVESRTRLPARRWLTGLRRHSGAARGGRSPIRAQEGLSL